MVQHQLKGDKTRQQQQEEGADSVAPGMRLKRRGRVAARGRSFDLYLEDKRRQRDLYLYARKIEDLVRKTLLQLGFNEVEAEYGLREVAKVPVPVPEKKKQYMEVLNEMVEEDPIGTEMGSSMVPQWRVVKQFVDGQVEHKVIRVKWPVVRRLSSAIESSRLQQHYHDHDQVPGARWRKGVSGNPEGTALDTRAVRRLAQSCTQEMMDQVRTLALGAENERVRLAAALAMLEHGHGKPGRAEASAGKRLEDMTKDELLEFLGDDAPEEFRVEN